MSSSKRSASGKTDLPVVEAAPKAPEGTSSAGAETPVTKSRHGLYFFLFFWLPLISLFVFAIVKGRGE